MRGGIARGRWAGTLLALLLAALATPSAALAAPARAGSPLVHPIDATTVALDRKTVLALFADPAPIQRQTWVVLHYRTVTGGPLEAKDVVGLELRGIDRGSDLDRAGLRTGDVVTHLDGTRVADFGTALGIGWRIRARAQAGETTVAMTLLRNGRASERTWHIVDAPGALPSGLPSDSSAAPPKSSATAAPPPVPSPAAPPPAVAPAPAAPADPEDAPPAPAPTPHRSPL